MSRKNSFNIVAVLGKKNSKLRKFRIGKFELKKLGQESNN